MPARAILGAVPAIAAALFAPGLAARAAADPLALRESALREPVYDVEVADVRLTWRADAVGASRGAGTTAAQATEQTASVGAEVAISSDDCDFVVVGGQLDARTGDGAPFAIQQWASLCPLSGALRFGLDHRLVWDVEPRLLAPPRLRPDGNRRETIGITVGARSETAIDPHALVPVAPEVVDLGTARIELGVGWIPDAPDATDASIAVDFDFVHYVRGRLDRSAPFHLHLLSVALDAVMLPRPAATQPGERWVNMAWAMRFDLARIEGARVAGFRIGAALGLADITLFHSDGVMGGWTEAMGGRAALSLERALGPVTARLGAGRELWPTWDGRGVIDDRVTASVAAEVAAVRGRLEVSAAQVGLLGQDTGFTQTVVGGATAIAERDLGRHLTARARVDVGESVYAPGASFDAPRWAAEGMLSLQLHAGTR